MKNFKLIFALLIGFTVVLTSCKKEKPEDDMPTEAVNEAASGSLNLGSKVTADFHGEIRDENGQALSDVTVTIGDKTETTDANGIFSILDASVDEELAYVQAEKTGYFSGSRSLIPSQSSTNAIKITMLELEVVGIISSNKNVTVSTNGAAVDLKGQYVDAVGNLYSGQVEVAMKFLPGSDPNTGSQMPGMLYAQNSNGESGALETYGMIAVELFGNSGQKLQIAAGSDATIHVPVDASQLANAPATIPLWYFDAAVGYWVEEGEATLENDEYVGVVDHFSFWNCDAFTVDAHVCGSVEDAAGNTFPNAQVTIITANATTTGTTGSDGSFCTYVPANQTITFEVSDECGNQLMTQTVGPYSVNTMNTEVLVASQTTNSLVVTGTVNDCQSNPITNGVIEVIIGSNSYFYPISNGTVNVILLNCVLPASIDVVVTDYATLTQGQISNVPVIGNNANIGTIMACTPSAEYITLTVDGNTNNFIVSMDCYQTDTTGQFFINIDGDTPTGDYIYITGSTITPGTYSLVQDVQSMTGFSFFTNAASNVDFTIAPTVAVNMVNYPQVGSYLDLTMVGTYYDASSMPHTLNMDVHILRDM